MGLSDPSLLGPYAVSRQLVHDQQGQQVQFREASMTRRYSESEGGRIIIVTGGLGAESSPWGRRLDCL